MKYKITILLVFLGLLFSKTIFAKEVAIDKAQKIAKNFYYERANLLSNISKDEIDISKVFTVKNNSTPLYYVFNLKNHKGFIIVSADDNVYPVLSYSLKGDYNKTNQPLAFEALMENFKQQILSVKKNNFKRSKKVIQAWDKYNSSLQNSKGPGVKNVSPLVASLWSQENFYNDSCPADVSGPGGNAVTGCVATAMGMIMKYHSYPTSGVGSHSYVHTPSNGFSNNYGVLKAHFGNTTYNWANMQDTVTVANSSMAQLIYHCGVAVEMDYSPNASGANSTDVPAALINYFSYSSSTKYEEKINYVDTIWTKLLRSELNAQRPLLYSGSHPTTQVGHAFICDGYQSPDFFHFNFGWGGTNNSYFYVNDLTPGTSNFNSNQSIVIIRPGGVGNWCSGTDTLTTQSGTFSDKSDSSFYNCNENCFWLIQPSGATSITLNFNSFSTQPSYDRFRVYEGADISTPMVANYSGYSLPATVTTLGGSMLIRFITDGTVMDEGWSVSYTSSNYPIANAVVTANTFCVGNNISFSDVSYGNISSYSWNFGLGASTLSSTSAGPHNISYSSSGQKTVTLTIVGPNGTSTDTLLVDIYNQPPTPSISYNGSVLVCSESGYSYEWFFNGYTISGQASQTCNSLQTGIYRVRITNPGGCRTMSDVFNFNTGIEETKLSNSINIFPNPNNGKFSINYENDYVGDVSLKVIDVTGRQLENIMFVKSKYEFSKELNFQELRSGIYFLSIEIDGVRVMKHFIVK